MTQKNPVATPCAAYNAMAEDWALPRALLGGTKAMRAAGKAYLPQEPAESDKAYENRLARAVLYNAFGQAIKDLRGKICAEEVKPAEDAPEEVKAWCEDVDLQGHNLHVFAARVLEDAIAFGLTHVLTDYPQGEPAKTRAEEQASGRRPYLVHIPAARLIGWRSRMQGGREVLEQVRIREEAVEPDGEFGEKTVSRIRVLEPGRYRLYEERKTATGTDWEVVDEGVTSLSFVPLVTLYAGRKGFMVAEPPLLDLAHLNVQHWQSSSDQQQILHFARVPLLFGKMLQRSSEEGARPIEIGPNRLVEADDPAADLRYVEHSGAAIGAGRESLADLEDKMRRLAMDPLVKRAGAVTATERALDSSEATSPLQDWAIALKDSLELALQFMGAWVKMPDGSTGSVIVHDPGEGLTGDAYQAAAVVMDGFKSGLLSREATIEELKRLRIVDDELDVVEVAAQLERDAYTSGAFAGLAGATLGRGSQGQAGAGPTPPAGQPR